MLTVAAGTVNVPFPLKSMDSTMATVAELTDDVRILSWQTDTALQRFQGARWLMPFFLCISWLYGEESHGDAQPYSHHHRLTRSCWFSFHTE